MVQIIHLFLLLATGQLLLVSGGQTTSLKEIKANLPDNLGNLQCTKKTCKSCESIQFKDILTLNISDTYCCKVSNHHCSLQVKVLKGSLFVYGVEFSQNSKQEKNVDKPQDCAKACVKNQNCQFFTFKRKRHCFLMASTDPPDIELKGNTISGYFQKNCCTDDVTSLLDDFGPHFYNESRSWFDALGFCHAQNYSLVEITDDTVEYDVKDLLQNKTNTQNGVWVGLERPIFGFNTTWRWITGGNVNVSQWNSSSPPSSTNKYCGKIIWVNETQTIKLLDDDCFNELPFICQDFT